MPKARPEGGDLFIVDNSTSGWTGSKYLREWCGISDSFDIATGFFEIGSLLDLDGDWQKLDKIRILMGDEVTHRTRGAFLQAVQGRASSVLDWSMDSGEGVEWGLIHETHRGLKCRLTDCDSATRHPR